jgi:hypothetical protein
MHGAEDGVRKAGGYLVAEQGVKRMTDDLRS